MILTIFAQYWVISQYTLNSCNFLLKIFNLLVNIGQKVLSSMVGHQRSEYLRIILNLLFIVLVLIFWILSESKSTVVYKRYNVLRIPKNIARGKIWHRRVSNHDPWSWFCWFLLFCCWFCWLQIKEGNIVFLCSCKCHTTTNLFKVQTLKVGNQLENFLLFCPLEQSCDIRGKRLTFTQAKDNQPDFKTTKIWNFTNWNFYKSFFSLQFQG